MDADEFRRQLEELNAEYRKGLPAKLAEIDALWAKSTTIDTGLLRAIHSMAGSAKTFGVKGVSEAAAAAEHYLAPFCERNAKLSSAQRTEFERLLGALRQAAGGNS
jgi:chemotaxis protein histidine kinase CheA